MQVTKIRSSASLIGDCTRFLQDNLGKIKQIYADSKIEEKTEKLPDGGEVTSVLFTRNNISIRFLPNRIDYTVSYSGADDSTQNHMDMALHFYKNLGQNFPDLALSRIAVVLQGFINNTDGSAIKYYSEKFGLTSVFGQSNELHFKINNPFDSFEKLNSVLNVDMGGATNNKTGKKTDVLLINVDVNSMANNTEKRFFAANVGEKFTALYTLAEQKIQNLQNL